VKDLARMAKTFRKQATLPLTLTLSPKGRGEMIFENTSSDRRR